MSGTLHITADASTVSMAASIRAAAQAAPFLGLTSRALGGLAGEFGSMEAAAEYLLAIAEEIGHPIAVNLATGADTSSTAFVSPGGWTEERLQGWVGGHHAELEDVFGTVARAGTERQPPGGRG